MERFNLRDRSRDATWSLDKAPEKSEEINEALMLGALLRMADAQELLVQRLGIGNECETLKADLASVARINTQLRTELAQARQKLSETEQQLASAVEKVLESRRTKRPRLVALASKGRNKRPAKARP